MEIKFWYDQEEQAIIVIHHSSGACRKIKKPKKIEEFLQVYRITLACCKRVHEDEDRLHLFKKMKVRQ